MVCEVCGVTELRADNLSGVCRKTTACDTERSRRFRKKHTEDLAKQAEEQAVKQASEVAQRIAWALDRAKEAQ